ncbi:NADAR family protein [Lachnospiraceae bacterium HCP1S3_C3]
MNVICFHNPDEENGFLSNWYSSHFLVNDNKFTSMEQYMMYKKAVTFNDEKIANEILSITDVAEIKRLGRTVSGYNDGIWNGLRQIIIYEGLIEKFIQNDTLREKLLETQDAILAECAVKDCIWGIGLSMRDDNRFEMSKWRGQNLLGYSLMMVREKIK